MKNSIKKGIIYAIIPARSGSKGVKNKNIRCLKGYPLIAYSIAAAKRCNKVSRIIISTDSVDYAKISNYYGAETPFIRPENISLDNSTDLEFMKHVINWLYENEHELPEYFMHLRPTAPIRKKEIVDNAVEKILSDRNATSLRSAHVCIHTPYKWFCMGEDGYYRSFIKELSIDQANNPRQNFDKVYIPDGYIDLLKTDFIINNNLLHGERVIGFVVPDSIDVDALTDIEKLEYYLDKNDEPLLSYLSAHYKTMSEVKL